MATQAGIASTKVIILVLGAGKLLINFMQPVFYLSFFGCIVSGDIIFLCVPVSQISARACQLRRNHGGLGLGSRGEDG